MPQSLNNKKRSTALEPAFSKINLSSEESKKTTGIKDSCTSFDDRRAKRLNEQEGICRSCSEPDV